MILSNTANQLLKEIELLCLYNPDVPVLFKISKTVKDLIGKDLKSSDFYISFIKIKSDISSIPTNTNISNLILLADTIMREIMKSYEK